MTQHLSKSEFMEKVFNFEEHKEWQFEGETPCIVDFYADWCQPCKLLGPVLDELAKEYDGKINIYKVDTGAEPAVAAVFGIRSIPSMLFVPSSGKPQMTTGLMPKGTIEKAIKDVLGVEAP